MLKNILIVNATYFPDLGGSGIVAKNTGGITKKWLQCNCFCVNRKTENMNGVKVIRNNTLDIIYIIINKYYNQK